MNDAMPALDAMEELQQLAACCPACAAANPPQRKFCSQCGALLWEPCLQCGELSAASGTYCGSCGANLADALAAQLERIDADLRAAAEAASSCRFDDAAERLRPIAQNEHPRLAERASRARHLLQQLGVQRSQRKIAAEQARQEALARFHAYDYDAAARLLDQTPPAFRTGEIEELRTQIAARREEIGCCEQNLRAAIAEKQPALLPPIIDRLLVLKPDHSDARKVAEQMQRQLVVAAERQLARHQYDESLRLLDLIDVRVRSPSTLELRRRAAEMVCLTHDLRSAPVVDPTLAAVGGRLRQLVSDDASCVKLCDELRRRVGRLEKSPGPTPLPWAKPPQQTALGPPVDALCELRQIACADGADASALLQNPGRYAVACGLALAGVRQAPLCINLRPAKQQGALHRITRLMRSDITAGRKAWGVDLGVSGLKAVRLAWQEPHRAVVDAVAMIEHAKPLSQAANEIEQKGLVADTLRAFLELHQPKTERISVSLPGRMALARYLELPPVKDAKARRLVQFESPHQFPVPLERLDWDYHFVGDAAPSGDAASGADVARRRVALLVGVQRHAVDRFLEPFRLLGLGIDVVQPDFVALHNFLVHEMSDSSAARPAEPPGATAAIDIGADVTNLVISSPQSFWHHSCGAAGHSFTRALVKDFKLSLAQAEQLKRRPESALWLSEVYESLSPVFEDLLQEVREALRAYGEAQPERPVRRILGLGGGFALHGLWRYLRCER